MGKWTTATVLVAILAACSGGPTGLDDGGPPDVVASIEVEKGEGQRGPPVEVLPDSVVGRVLNSAGDPMSGVFVNFETPGGTFDADGLTTNGNGRVFNELTTGEVAWTARVAAGEDSAFTARLVASRDGRPDEIASFTFAVDPDPAASAALAGGRWSMAEGPFSARLEAPGSMAPDEHGNPALFRLRVGPGMLDVLDARMGWPSGRTLVLADSAAFSAMEGDTLFYSDGQVRQVEATGPAVCVETAMHGPAESGVARIQKRFDKGVVPSDSTAEIAVWIDVPDGEQFGQSPVCP